MTILFFSQNIIFLLSYPVSFTLELYKYGIVNYHVLLVNFIGGVEALPLAL